MVEVGAGSFLGRAGRSWIDDRREEEFPGGPYCLGGCECFCEMGRKAVADRGGVGICGARRDGGRTVCFGRNDRFRWKMAREYLAGKISDGKPGRGRFCPIGAG